MNNTHTEAQRRERERERERDRILQKKLAPWLSRFWNFCQRIKRNWRRSKHILGRDQRWCIHAPPVRVPSHHLLHWIKSLSPVEENSVHAFKKNIQEMKSLVSFFPSTFLSFTPLRYFLVCTPKQGLWLKLWEFCFCFLSSYWRT